MDRLAGPLEQDDGCRPDRRGQQRQDLPEMICQQLGRSWFSFSLGVRCDLRRGLRIRSKSKCNNRFRLYASAFFASPCKRVVAGTPRPLNKQVVLRVSMV